MPPSIPPKNYRAMRDEHPALMTAYEAFGQACSQAGPLDRKSISLIKLAISLGAGIEGAAHAHARKALDAGCTRDELLHVAHLCAPTIGFPPMMRARRWVLDELEARTSKPAAPRSKSPVRSGRTTKRSGK